MYFGHWFGGRWIHPNRDNPHPRKRLTKKLICETARRKARTVARESRRRNRV